MLNGSGSQPWRSIHRPDLLRSTTCHSPITTSTTTRSNTTSQTPFTECSRSRPTIKTPIRISGRKTRTTSASRRTGVTRTETSGPEATAEVRTKTTFRSWCTRKKQCSNKIFASMMELRFPRMMRFLKINRNYIGRGCCLSFRVSILGNFCSNGSNLPRHLFQSNHILPTTLETCFPRMKRLININIYYIGTDCLLLFRVSLFAQLCNRWFGDM